MTERLESNLVKRFVKLFHARYSSESKLSDYCDITVYQDDLSRKHGSFSVGNETYYPSSRGHGDLTYNQIGSRTLAPPEAITSDFAIQTINSFVKSLRTGERNYLLSQLDDKNIPTVNFDEASYEEFTNWCKQVKDPDHLFLPLDSTFHTKVFDWRIEHDFFIGDGETALDGTDLIKIHWIPLKTGITNGYLINSDGLSVVQKWFGDSPDPKGFEHNPEFDEYSKNRPSMVYLGNEIVEDHETDDDYTEKVEFLYRVILSEIFVENDAAVKLEPTKELSD